MPPPHRAEEPQSRSTASSSLLIRRARLPGEPDLRDVLLDGGRIAGVTSHHDGSADHELDAGGRVLTTAFVEPHIHLDKVEVAPVLPPNRSGTLAEAIELLHEWKRQASVESVADRAEAVVRRAVANGTTAMRTHVDVDTIGGLTPLRGVLEARRRVAHLCDIQIVAFPQEGIIRDPGTAQLLREALRCGADLVGGMPHWERTPAAARAHIETCFDLAAEFDVPVDMHIDETDDPASRTLEMLADVTVARGWEGRVTAGHCCAMAAWDDGYAQHVIGKVRDAGIRIVTNPATNLLLQGRGDREPRRRGLPRIKELLAAGVVVAAGQDCVNDAFYPFGAPDALQVLLIACHAAQLSTPDEIEAGWDMVGRRAAEVLRLADYRLAAGGRGDLVVLDADDLADALRYQADRSWVVRQGRVVAETRRTTVIHDETTTGAHDDDR
jgi:cytosine deaminase